MELRLVLVRSRSAAADADRHGGLVLRFRGHAAGAADADAAGDGDRAAEAADLDRIAVLARIKPVTKQRAVADEAETRAGPGDRADRDVPIGRTDADRCRRPVLAHYGISFLCLLVSALFLILFF